MTRKEAIKRIEELERKEFMIYMVDFWTTEDRAKLKEIEEEIRQLKAII